jgi:hypothetical protein
MPARRDRTTRGRHAWAPEAIVDPATGALVLTWSSTVYDQVTDPDHRGVSYSRILSANHPRLPVVLRRKGLPRHR